MAKFKFVCKDCKTRTGKLDPCWLSQNSDLMPTHCPHGFSINCHWERVERITKE